MAVRFAFGRFANCGTRAASRSSPRPRRTGCCRCCSNRPKRSRAQVLIGCDVLSRHVSARSRGILAAGMRLLTRPRRDPAGSESALVHSRCPWARCSGSRVRAVPSTRPVLPPPVRQPSRATGIQPTSLERKIGYPGDPAYRDFYRDIGFDLPPEQLFPGTATKTPRFTGLKYHRITGGDEREGTLRSRVGRGGGAGARGSFPRIAPAATRRNSARS